MDLDEFKTACPDAWAIFEDTTRRENWNIFRHACGLQFIDPLREFLLVAAWILIGQQYGDYNVHDIEQLEELEDTLRHYGVY
jgi:hypothetical protein